MIRAIVFFAIAAVGFVQSALAPGLRVTFGMGLGIDKKFLFKVPQFIQEAIEKKWLLMERPPSHLPSLVMYCVDELTFCCLYDHITTYVAGFQIGLPMNEYTGSPFDYDIQGYTAWKPPVESGEPVTYMTKQVYLVSEETLKKNAEERNKTVLAKPVLQEDSIWVTGFNKQLMKIPTNEKGIVDVGFTKQACFPWMGQHYYYQMSSKTECKEDTLFNWFPLTDDNKMIGIGFTSFGYLTEKKGKTCYFERPPRTAVQIIVPSGPQCLYELADKPTLTTMHIYFIDNPWKMWCMSSGK